jgi:2-aminoethylphosphonate-pyruvate transaminase
MDLTSVILAAGQGKRFRNLSQYIHKCLIQVEDKPLICHSIDKLISVGFNRIIIVVGFEAEVLTKFLNSKYGKQVELVVNKQFNSAGNFVSLYKALSLVNSDCFVLDADIVYERKALLKALDEKKSNFFVTTNLSNSSDSVLVKTLNGSVTRISKNVTLTGDSRTSEYIGILKLNEKLVTFIKNLDPKNFHELDYEGFIDNHVLSKCDFSEVFVPNLIWAEVDNEADLIKIKKWDLSVLSQVTCT